MNCGCEYTSFPRFRAIGRYSRYDHSVGVGRIVYEHTLDARQAIAGLLHDVATPVFAHVIDFMRGDHMKQESTEDRTLEIISSDVSLVDVLRRLGLSPLDVSDYHLFPIADNDTPRLSADRLEYTLGNGVLYGFASSDEVAQMYSDIVSGVNEFGEPELMFRDLDVASKFAFMSLSCSKIYVSDADRYAMQILAELMAKYIGSGVLSESDLWTTEPRVIDKITSSGSDGSRDWSAYCSLHQIRVGGEPDPSSRTIDAKKRHINPYVQGRGRVTALSDAYATALSAYLSTSFSYPVSAE